MVAILSRPSRRTDRGHHAPEGHDNRQAGGVLILVLGITAVLLILIGGIVHFGYYYYAQGVLQTATKLGASAALETYARTPPSVVFPARLNAAKATAESIVNRHRLVGLPRNGTPLQTELRSGWYYFSDPDGTGPENPCPTPPGYPCYVENSAAATTANALRVLTSNRPTHPFHSPMEGFIGSNLTPNVRAEAIVSSVPQCTVFAIDVSASMVGESYPTAKGLPLLTLRNGAFTFNAACAAAAGCPSAAETALWKNLPQPRNDADPALHFKDDYRIENVILDGVTTAVLVDKYQPLDSLYPNHRGPEPLSSTLLALQGISAWFAERSQPGDQFGMVSFDSTVRFQEPLRPDAEFFIQIFNPHLRGTYDMASNLVTSEAHINLLDRGLFPRPISADLDTSTNLLGGLSAAAAILEGCPEYSRRSIILATDGIAGCPVVGGTLSCSGSNPYQNYRAAIQQIENQFLPVLNGRRVTIHTIVAGKRMLDFHFINRVGQNQALLDVQGALADGIPSPSIFDTVPRLEGPAVAQFTAWFPANCPSGDDECVRQFAFEHVGHEGVYFPPPLATLAKIAGDTGGRYCMALPTCQTSSCHGGRCYVDHDQDCGGRCEGDPGYDASLCTACRLEDEERTPNDRQNCAVLDLPDAPSVVSCVGSWYKNSFVMIAE